MRRIAVLILYPENDPQGGLRTTAFQQELERLGWKIGQNLQINHRWGTGDAEWIRGAARQLLEPMPDLIVANGSAAARAVKQLTATVPVVFIAGGDPVAEGLVQSLAHPGGNVTGFTVLEPGLGAKLLELLKELAPRVAKVAVLFSPDGVANQQEFESAKAAGAGLSVEVTHSPWSDPTELEASMAKWGQASDFGLIVSPDPRATAQRGLFIELADRYRLPAIYGMRVATVDGGLASYGVDVPTLFREAARYASHILKGEKPGALPVQLPTKFELAINMKTAKALGLVVPDWLLATADEVIE
jgi:putative tryptophan/tyrosine transport system substrate-binding protein